ncbi:MAG TPA: TIR domain-containing protein [Candidatus Acidoferrales bacterium]|nr:TIR domain-containing protein [Candidatus Acidoferrales bacterium]
MEETSNVFISQSGPRSRRVAEALKDLLPTIIPAAKPWISTANIDPGTRWRDEIIKALNTMKAGIVCLTSENLTAEWILFEAGALSKASDTQARVWTYLIGGLEPQDVKDPLGMFQATRAEKEGTRKLIHSINENLGSPIEQKRLDSIFDRMWWTDLEKEMDSLPASEGAAPLKRSSDEIAADTLELVRGLIPIVQDIASEAEMTRQKRLAEEQVLQYSVFSNVGPGALAFTPAGGVMQRAKYANWASPLLVAAQDSLRTDERNPQSASDAVGASVPPRSPRTHAPRPRRKRFSHRSKEKPGL